MFDPNFVFGLIADLKALSLSSEESETKLFRAKRRRLAGVLRSIEPNELWKLAALQPGRELDPVLKRARWDFELRRRLWTAEEESDRMLLTSADLSADGSGLLGDTLACLTICAFPLLPGVIGKLEFNPSFLGLLVCQTRFLCQLNLACDEVATARQRVLEAKYRLLDDVAQALPANASIRDLVAHLRPLRDAVEGCTHTDFVRSSCVEPRLAEFMGTLVRKLGEEQPDIRSAASVLLCMTLQTPEFLAEAGDWIYQVPEWRTELVHQLCLPIKLFRDADHGSRYETFVERSLDRLIAQRDGISPSKWKEIAGEVINRFRISGLYGISSSLLGIQRRRGELLDDWMSLKHPGYGAPAIRATAPAQRRIGFLFAHTNESTENATALAYMSGMDRERFHVEAFLAPHSPGESVKGPLLSRVATASEAVFDLSGLPLAERAAVLRQRGLSALIIVNNITWGISDYIELAAHRLAPVQIVTYASVITTGFRNIDVWLSAVESESSPSPQDFYSERLVQKPGSVLCFAGISLPEVKRTMRESRRRKAPVFISGANMYKINSVVLDAWIAILARVPGAELRLYPFNPNWDKAYPRFAFEEELATRCREQGIDRTRIRLVGPWPDQAEMYRELSEADVYLDSFPHSGGLSTLDPLLVGTPVVTLKAAFQRGTQGANVLEAAGLADWVSEDVAGYIGLAVRLAEAGEDERSRISLDALKASPMMDAARFGEELSSCLEQLLSEEPAEPQAGIPSPELTTDTLWVWQRDGSANVFGRPQPVRFTEPIHAVRSLSLSGQFLSPQYRHLTLEASEIAGPGERWDRFSFRIQVGRSAQGTDFIGIELRPEEASPQLPSARPPQASEAGDAESPLRIYFNEGELAVSSRATWEGLDLAVRLAMLSVLQWAKSPPGNYRLKVEAAVELEQWRPVIAALQRAVQGALVRSLTDQDHAGAMSMMAGQAAEPADRQAP